MRLGIWWWVLGNPLHMSLRGLSSIEVHLSLCVGLWDEWGAEDVGDLSPGGGAQRSRPPASGKKSYCQHTKVHKNMHTHKHTVHEALEYNTLKLSSFCHQIVSLLLFKYCESSPLFYFILFCSVLFYSSALSQDEQDDAQLRIEDILQMVRKLQHIKSSDNFLFSHCKHLMILWLTGNYSVKQQ